MRVHGDCRVNTTGFSITRQIWTVSTLTFDPFDVDSGPAMIALKVALHAD